MEPGLWECVSLARSPLGSAPLRRQLPPSTAKTSKTPQLHRKASFSLGWNVRISPTFSCDLGRQTATQRAPPDGQMGATKATWLAPISRAHEFPVRRECHRDRRPGNGGRRHSSASAPIRIGGMIFSQAEEERSVSLKRLSNPLSSQ